MSTHLRKGEAGTGRASSTGWRVGLLVLVALVSVAFGGAEWLAAQAGSDPGPPTQEELHPADPADSLYRAARAALSDGDYERAAGLFADLRKRSPDSEYVADSLYFEALALQRMGGSEDLRRALELLATQLRTHREAATTQDARALTMRLRSQLAQIEQQLARIRQEGQRMQQQLQQARLAQALQATREAGQETERTRQEAQRQAQAVQERMARSLRTLRAAERVARDARRGGAGQACEDAGEETRMAALHALLRMDPERARPLLLEVLRDSDPCSAELREQALFVIGRELGVQAVDLFLDLAVRNPDPDPDVRGAAIFWLGRAATPEARDAIESILLTTDDPDLQEQALVAAGRGDPERAADALRRFLERDDLDDEVREEAIVWLGQRGGEEGFRYLRSIYGTVQDPDLRASIVFGVGRGASPESRAWLLERVADPSESPELRTHAAFALGRTGEIPVAALGDIFARAEDPGFKRGLLDVMARAEESDLLVETMSEVARSEEDREVRERAIAWLGRSDDPRAAEVLLEIVRGGGGDGER